MEKTEMYQKKFKRYLQIKLRQKKFHFFLSRVEFDKYAVRSFLLTITEVGFNKKKALKVEDDNYVDCRKTIFPKYFYSIFLLGQCPDIELWKDKYGRKKLVVTHTLG